MKKYLKKAYVKRNLDSLCEFVHQQIDETNLEVDKVSIKTYSKERYDLIHNYTVLARFVKNSKNNPIEFTNFNSKIDKIFKDTTVSVMIEHDINDHYIFLALGVNKNWLEQKDIVNSLTSKAGIIKYNL